MRLRRLCEVKPSGKSHVDDDIRKEYQMGGDKREILEIALVEALKKWGTSKSKSIFNKVKASSLKHGLHVFFYTLCTGVLYMICALWTECFQITTSNSIVFKNPDYPP